jgi:hypothetical protein
MPNSAKKLKACTISGRVGRNSRIYLEMRSKGGVEEGFMNGKLSEKWRFRAVMTF